MSQREPTLHIGFPLMAPAASGWNHRHMTLCGAMAYGPHSRPESGDYNDTARRATCQTCKRAFARRKKLGQTRLVNVEL